MSLVHYTCVLDLLWRMQNIGVRAECNDRHGKHTLGIEFAHQLNSCPSHMAHHYMDTAENMTVFCLQISFVEGAGQQRSKPQARLHDTRSLAEVEYQSIEQSRATPRNVHLEGGSSVLSGKVAM